MNGGRNSKVYMPVRNIICSLVPISIIAWYCIDKPVDARLYWKIIIICIAILIQGFIIWNSTHTRRTHRSSFWGIINYLTGNGRLPLKLVASFLIFIIIIAFGFELTGLSSQDGVPSSFIVRFVEIDLYWTILNFLGISDSAIIVQGFGKSLTILTSIGGLLFWGLYVSILVNKHIEMQDLKGQLTSQEKIDLVHYNEGNVSPDNSWSDQSVEKASTSQYEDRIKNIPPVKTFPKIIKSGLITVLSLVFFRRLIEHFFKTNKSN